MGCILLIIKVSTCKQVSFLPFEYYGKNLIFDPPRNPNEWKEKIFEFQLDDINQESIFRSFFI